MREHIDRSEGRRLFGLNPQGYDDSRPDYPEWIFEHLRERGALKPGTATLEIGAGTGRATRRLLEHGANPLVIVEPDVRFAESLRAVTRAHRVDCRVLAQTFEDAEMPPGHFDLVAAATSFHWVDQAAGLAKARRILEPGGVAALFWNVLSVAGRKDAFHDATVSLLSPLAVSPSGAPDSVPFALDRLARETDALAAGFSRIDYQESTWTLLLNTGQVGKLYEGFSHIQRLDEASRTHLLAQLMGIADAQFGGRVERNVTSCLYVLS